MAKTLYNLSQKVLEISFYLLLFLVPLVLTPFNYELFEYNKMMLTYGLTIIIVGSWLIKMISIRQIKFRRTPLDIPLVLFLASQIVSTFISLDPHVSLWGYYSRFNGGLLSTTSYLFLYWAFVSNFPREKIRRLLKIALASGVLVSIFGVLEHLGIDKNIWVQDVQNRVFSTLGQPNWLAAYLAVLIPIGIGLSLNPKSEYRNSKQYQNNKDRNSKRFDNSNFGNSNLFRASNFVLLILIAVFYATLIFTKSRSGFMGLWIALIIFWLLSFIFSYIINFKSSKSSQSHAVAYVCDSCFKFLNISIIGFIIITFLFGSPFDQLNRFTLPEITNRQLPTTNQQPPSAPAGSSIIEVGITGSDTIRKIVWGGAIDIFRYYPLFGTGVETFAFAYYKYRPVAHNMTSEWDFLYNKAHNEYLNYAATTGSFGLGSYLLIILIFIGWNFSNLKTQSSNVKTTTQNLKLEKFKVSDLDLRSNILHLSLFSGWLSILITNFFGFSVVIIQLFLFLIPAISFTLVNETDNRESRRKVGIHDAVNVHSSQTASGQITDNRKTTLLQYILASGILFVICYLLFVICRMWYADILYADGYHRDRSDDVAGAYRSLKKALDINENEPVYYDEFSYPAAQLAVAFSDEKQATLSAVFTREAILASTYAINHAPQNVNFWKSRTRVFYALSQLDEKYFPDALYALQQAKILSPTDPKVSYNLGLLYDRIGKTKEAIDELVTTTKLKPDYRDAFYALGYLYEKDDERDKAKDALKYILAKIATDDAEAKKKLEELK